MARTVNVFTRVAPETKEQAEAILNQLGIPMSNAISMFLKQIVMQRGIPFDLKIPSSVPVAIGSMTKEQLDMSNWGRFFLTHFLHSKMSQINCTLNVPDYSK